MDMKQRALSTAKRLHRVTGNSLLGTAITNDPVVNKKVPVSSYLEKEMLGIFIARV
jgi:hypothetical protein